LKKDLSIEIDELEGTKLPKDSTQIATGFLDMPQRTEDEELEGMVEDIIEDESFFY